MLRRVSEMEFAPSMMVFPGGSVDDRDGEIGLPWAGPSPSEWADRLGCSPAEAQMYVAAAIREVFEECGVLLAGPSASGPLAWSRAPSGATAPRARRPPALARRRAPRQGPRPALRPHRRQGALADPGLRAAPLRHVVLRRAHAAAPDGRRRHQRGRPGRVGVPAELLSAYAAGSALMLPPTVMWVEEIRDGLLRKDFVHSEHLPSIMPEVVDSPLGPAMEVVER